jgi:hypothetical protein
MMSTQVTSAPHGTWNEQGDVWTAPNGALWGTNAIILRQRRKADETRFCEAAMWGTRLQAYCYDVNEYTDETMPGRIRRLTLAATRPAFPCHRFCQVSHLGDATEVNRMCAELKQKAAKAKLPQSGQRFGYLEFIRAATKEESETERQKGRHKRGRRKSGSAGVYWLMKCTRCGSEVFKYAKRVRLGKTTSCGCLKEPKIDETGNKYGLRVVVRQATREEIGRSGTAVHWLVRCTDCHRETIIPGNRLRRGRRDVCHCQRLKAFKAACTKDRAGVRSGFLEASRLATADEIEQCTRRKYRGAVWVCKCHNCGREGVILPITALTHSHVKSCGCLRVQTAKKRVAKLVANGQLFKKKKPTLVLGEFGGYPIINGKRKRPLTEPQYDVVRAIADEGELGLTTSQLDQRTRHGDARRVLKNLAMSDADWASIILFPGKKNKGQGYRIVT